MNETTRMRIGIVTVAVTAMALATWAGQLSKFDTDDAVGVDSELLFPAHSVPNRVVSILAKTGTSTGRIDIYARSSVTNNPQTVTNVTAAAGETNIGVTATSAFSAGAYAVYQYADGTCSNAQIKNVVAGKYVELTNGLHKAGAAGDKLYALSKQGVVYTGNSALNIDGTLFVSLPDSPIWFDYVATNANYITSTIEW